MEPAVFVDLKRVVSLGVPVTRDRVSTAEQFDQAGREACHSADRGAGLRERGPKDFARDPAALWAKQRNLFAQLVDPGLVSTVFMPFTLLCAFTPA
jgi:hypothetical protein